MLTIIDVHESRMPPRTEKLPASMLVILKQRLTPGELARLHGNMRTWEKRSEHRMSQRATRQRAAAARKLAAVTTQLASCRRATQRANRQLAECRWAASQRVATRQRAYFLLGKLPCILFLVPKMEPIIMQKIS